MELQGIGKGIVSGLKKVTGIQAIQDHRAAKAAEKQAEIDREQRIAELKELLAQEMVYMEPLRNCFVGDDPYMLETLDRVNALSSELKDLI